MTNYNPIRNSNSNGKTRPYFNFRKNIPNRSTSFKPSLKTCEKRNEMYPSTIVYSTTMFDGSYSSAMEPMDCDEWTDEEWDDKGIHQMNSNAMKQKQFLDFQQRAPITNQRQLPYYQKNERNFPISKMKQVPPPNVANFIERPLIQSVLNVDNTSGVSYKIDENQKKMRPVLDPEVNAKKIYPKWNLSSERNTDLEHKGLSFPRVLTTTVEKLMKWPKVLTGTRIISIVYGILSNVVEDKLQGSKVIYLKGETKKDCFSCKFYEIDRRLPFVEKGHWLRCVILLRCKGDYQCLSIRSATPNELQKLDQMISVSSKEKALLLKALSK